MRFREKAALLACATLLSVSFSSKTPLADGWPKQKPWTPEIEGVPKEKIKKYQKSGLLPKYEPLGLKGTGKLAKLKQKALYVEPKDYQLDFIKEGVEAARGLVQDFEYDGKRKFRFSVKKMAVGSGKTYWVKIKIEDRKHKGKAERLQVASYYFTKPGHKGYWICGISLAHLAKRYEKETGQELQFAAYGMQKKGNGDVDFYVIPVATFGDAREGRISAGVPFLILPYSAAKDEFTSGNGRNLHNIVENKEGKEDAKDNGA